MKITYLFDYLPDDEIHVSDGNSRKCRKSITEGQRNAHIDLRNASFASRIANKCRTAGFAKVGWSLL